MQFDWTVIDLDCKLFAANLLYVAITRNKTLAGMTLVGRLLHRKDFLVHPEKLRQIDEECTRIDSLQLPTLETILEIITQYFSADVQAFFDGSFDE